MVSNPSWRDYCYALKEALIYVSFTLGYDVDKDLAQKLLIDSAQKNPRRPILVPGKMPFVLLRNLGSYAITYEINAYTNESNRLIQIKSDLINNILTEFKLAGVEIMSPTHIAMRESQNTVTTPKYLGNLKNEP